MAKVTCESCGSSFPLEKAKGMQNCPVCGEALWEEEIENVDYGDEVMYFDEIVIFDNEPEYSHVSAYCKYCSKSNSLDIDKFDELIDKKYVIIKEGVAVKCRGCGEEHTSRKIMYKRKDHYAPPLPRCPVCNSAMLKKITTGSKFLAAATLGTFALPYNSKTFECKDCGYRF